MNYEQESELFDNLLKMSKAMTTVFKVLDDIVQRLNRIEDSLHMGYEENEVEFTQSELDDMMQRDLDEETLQELDATIIPFGRKNK